MENTTPTQDSDPIQETDKDLARHVKIKTMDNRSADLHVDPKITISDLKVKIEAALGYEPSSQRLICKAKLLKDHETLDSYVSEDGEAIHVMANPRSQSTTQATPTPETNNAQGNPPGPNLGNNGTNQPQNPGNLINQLLGGLGGMQGDTQVTISTGTLGGIGGNDGQANNPLGNIMNLFGGLGGLGGGIPTRNATQPAQGQDQPQPIPTVTQSATIRIDSAPIRTVNPASNGVVGMNNAGVQISMQHMRNNQVIDGQTTFNLPSPALHRVGDHISNIYGFQESTSNIFPGIPTNDTPNSSLTLLGGYINSVHHQMSMLIPVINRLGQLFQNEPYLSNPAERQRLFSMAVHAGRAVNDLLIALGPIADILSNLRVGQTTGMFGVSPDTVDADSNVENQELGENPVSGSNPNSNPQSQANPARSPNYANGIRGTIQRTMDNMGQRRVDRIQNRIQNRQQRRQDRAENPRSGRNPISNLATNIADVGRGARQTVGLMRTMGEASRQSNNQQAGVAQPNPLAGLLGALGGGGGSNGQANPLAGLLGSLTQGQSGGNGQANPLAGLLGALGGGGGGQGDGQNPLAGLLGALNPGSSPSQQPAPQQNQRTAQEPQNAQQQPAQQANPLGDILGSLLQPQGGQNGQGGAQPNPLGNIIGNILQGGPQQNQSNDTEGGENTQQNPLGGLMGMLNQNGGLGGLMNMTMREMTERSGINQGDDFENALFAPLTIGQMMNLMQGNVDCLDTNHSAIKESLNEYIEKVGGIEEAEKKFNDMNKNIYTSKLVDDPCVYPGFDPVVVLEEVTGNHFQGFIEMIRRDGFNPDNKFSTSQHFILRSKKYYGELSYNISEGLENGIEDFKRTTKEGFSEYAGRLLGDPSMGAMMGSLYSNTFWNLIEGCYEYHCNVLNGTEEQMTVEVMQSNENRTNEITSILQNMDADVEDPSQDLQYDELSETYLKGKCLQSS